MRVHTQEQNTHISSLGIAALLCHGLENLNPSFKPQTYIEIAESGIGNTVPFSRIGLKRVQAKTCKGPSKKEKKPTKQNSNIIATAYVL